MRGLVVWQSNNSMNLTIQFVTARACASAAGEGVAKEHVVPPALCLKQG
jgi:hypothetical protein